VQDLGAAVGTLSLMILPMTLVACVIPPSLKPEDDAGVNSPPAIVSISDLVPEPGPVPVARGDTTSTFRVSLIDTDVDDKLIVRIFVDYNMPDRLPARVQCPVASTTSAARMATCNVAGLCATADVGVQRNMTIVVFDRPLKDSGDPQQMMDPAGLSTYRFYFLKCQPPQTQ
jgi:hypothetical protein